MSYKGRKREKRTKEGRTPGDPSSGHTKFGLPGLETNPAQPRPAPQRPDRRSPGRLPWQPSLACVAEAHNGQVSLVPTPPPPLTWPSARPRRSGPMDTHTPLPAAPRACSPALPRGTPFTTRPPSRPPRARGLRWGPRLAAEDQNRPPAAEVLRCPDIRGS